MWLLKKIINETVKVIPAVIYFIILLNFIHFNENLMLGPNTEHYYSYLTVTLSAILIGKVLIIANNLPGINSFPNKPLIYNIVWKAFFYAVLILLIRIGESIFRNFYQDKDFHIVLIKLKNELTQPIFWCTQSWLFLAFLGYIIFSELVRVLGKKRVINLFFGNKIVLKSVP